MKRLALIALAALAFSPFAARADITIGAEAPDFTLGERQNY